MSNFTVPTRENVSENNQAIFDKLKGSLGFVPNIYAGMAHSDNALSNFLTFSGAATSFSKKEKEVIDLAISQVNECKYCQSAHSAIAKMNGFTDEQILDLRHGHAEWDSKLDALAKISREIALNRGNVSAEVKQNFTQAGYTEENLVDLAMAVGAITITNVFHNLTKIAIDFPVAPELETVHAKHS